MVPMRLAARGIDVTAVDIDVASLHAAMEVFGFDRNKVNTLQADARTYLRSCNGGYDVALARYQTGPAQLTLTTPNNVSRGVAFTVSGALRRARG